MSLHYLVLFTAINYSRSASLISVQFHLILELHSLVLTQINVTGVRYDKVLLMQPNPFYCILGNLLNVQPLIGHWQPWNFVRHFKRMVWRFLVLESTQTKNATKQSLDLMHTFCIPCLVFCSYHTAIMSKSAYNCEIHWSFNDL